MNVWKMFKKCISVVIAIAIVMSLAAPVLAADGNDDGIYLAMGDDMSNGIGLANQNEDTYAVQVAKKLYGDQWESHYKLRAGAKYRVEELRYLVEGKGGDYSGDGYTKQFYTGAAGKAFYDAWYYNHVRDEVADAEYITISAGVNNFSTYIVEQMLYYVQNGGKTKYSYDIASVLDNYAYGNTSGGDVYGELENIKSIVKNELMGAAGDTMADAVELVDFVAEVSAYAVLSYCVNFNELISEIKTINPDAKIYVIGIYNAMAGEKVSVTVDGQYHDVEIGKYFGALLEIANAYTQILAPRVYDYTYVHPGNPQLLIDVMGDDSLSITDRIPKALKTKLLNATENTAVSMIMDMYEAYGITGKDYNDAADLAYEIFEAEGTAARLEIIKAEIDGYVIPEISKEFSEQLTANGGVFGDNIGVELEGVEINTNVKVTSEEIEQLLKDLEAEATREQEASDFVVSLMAEAMKGQTFAGIEINSQDDFEAAIELLKNAAGSDPVAKREAAAQAAFEELKKTGKHEQLGIKSSADVYELLELMDTHTTKEAREEAVDGWLQEKAADRIYETVHGYVPTYTKGDAEDLLKALNAAPETEHAAIAEAHLIQHFKLAEIMEAKYRDAGFGTKPATFETFADFEYAINNPVDKDGDGDADADDIRIIVRNEIRMAAAPVILDEVTGTGFWSKCTCDGEHDPNTCSGLTKGMMLDMLATVDTGTTEDAKKAALHSWMVTNLNDGKEPTGDAVWLFELVKNGFWSGYSTYNDAATTAEELCADYHDSFEKSSELFGSYAALMDQAKTQIIAFYDQYYLGSGETAQNYYAGYLSLHDAAVIKILDGYKKYQEAITQALDSVTPLSEAFDGVFELLCEIAEVDDISLNDILAVAKKVQAGGYIENMMDDLMQGDSLAKEDKTVAYLALRYYLADSMMIMPSAAGHKTIANQVIKAIDGKDTSSTAGYYANKVIDKAIDVYRCANAYRDLSSSESGQVDPVINPDLYVALGDNVTSGTALDNADLAYPQLVADALAMSADDRDGADKVCNYAINGMRVEELLMLVDDSYNGDEYTADRFGTDYIASLREAYREDIANADLITINVGINNLTTYPITQTLLAYNGEEPYEMDWARFIGSNYAGKIEAGKDAAMDLALYLVDNAESRSETLDGLSAYERCERALNTMFTAIESTLYSYISYIFTLDDAVEQIAALNKDGTIALIGLYNPLEGTYFQIDRAVTVRGKTIDLSQFDVNVDKLADMMLNLVNRYHANYVGSIDGNGTAADEGSRLLNVKINDTELFVTNDDSISKDLSALTRKEITFKGKTIPVYVPEYFVQPVKSEGEALHPNAAGHQYIADQILKALDFEIYADVIVEDYTKTYGDADPDFTHLIDDLSSLWGIEVTEITREPGEEVGTYALSAVYTADDGYTEIDEEFGSLTITKRKATIDVIVDANGEVKSFVFSGAVNEDDKRLELNELTITTDENGVYVGTCTDEYILNNYDLTIKVVVEEPQEPEKIQTTVAVTVKPAKTTDKITAVAYDANFEEADKARLEAGLKLNYSAGNYDVTFESDDTYITDKYDLTINVNVEWITWAGTNTKLGGILELNFVLKADQFKDLTTDNYIELTRTYADGTTDTVTIPQSQWNNDDVRYFKVTYSKLAAKEMGDVITGIVYNAAGERISEIREDSMATYCMRMLGRADMYNNAYTRNLFVSMLNYGAAAQVYFGYDTENLVNAELANVVSAEHLAEWENKTVDPKDYRVQGANYAGSTLDLENEIFMNIVFTGTFTDGMYAKVSYKDHYKATYNRDSRDEGENITISTQGSFIIVSIGDIAIADHCAEISCELYNANGTLFGSAIDSRESYVARNREILKKNGVDLGAAIMKFGEFAYDYFRSIEK